MKKIVYIYIATCLLFLASCSDFLKPDSSTEYTPTEVSSLEEMLLGEAYPGRLSSGLNYWGFLNFIDDDLTARPYINLRNSTTNMSEYEDLAVQSVKILYSWTTNYQTSLKTIGGSANVEMYNKVYKLIAGANAALDYLDDMEGTDNEKRNVRAQAHALRAFHYFHLTNIYGTPYHSHSQGLGVPLKLVSGIEDRRMMRNTVKECYDQIVSDLLIAEENYVAMGEMHVWKRNYRTSLAMVRLMLSRVYLYMENWEESSRYAKLVIDDSTFSLYDLTTMPVPNIESALSKRVGYTDFISYQMTTSEGEVKEYNPETIWVYGSVNDGFNNSYLLTGVSTTNQRKTALFNASDELLGLFGTQLSDEAKDLRLDHYIVTEHFKGSTSLKRAYGKIRLTNYTNGRWPDASPNGVFGRSLRLSEAYLNYAEAVVMAGKEGKGSMGEALGALNTLRFKRIANCVALNATDFLNIDELVSFIRDERRREFCFEGHRWFDLRRYGMPEIKHKWFDDNNSVVPAIMTLSSEDPYYAIPLPESTLEENSALDPNSWK